MKPEDLLQDSFYEKEKRREQELRDQFRPDKRAARTESGGTRRLVFFDLLLIVIIMGVIYPFIAARFGPDRWTGSYHYQYSGVLLNNRIIHNLEVEGREDLQGDPSLMEVRFSAGENSEVIVLKDLAPGAGQIRRFSAEQEMEELPENMQCLVILEGEELHFRRKLGRISYLEPFRGIFSSGKN